MGSTIPPFDDAPASPESRLARSYVLLREKADLTADQQERQALIDEAESLSTRAAEVRTKPGPPNG